VGMADDVSRFREAMLAAIREGYRFGYIPKKFKGKVRDSDPFEAARGVLRERGVTDGG
jgi:hypothetical protein